MVTLNPSASAVTLFDISDGNLRQAGRLTPADGLPIQAPTEIDIVSLAGQDYALVGASGSSSVSVLWITRGQMIPVDHIIDDRNSRFEGLTVLETIEYEGRVFVLASGRDDGVSLLTMLPGGQLMMLDTLVDATDAPMSDITAIELVEVDNSLMAFVSGEGWEGVSALDLRTGSLGPVQIGSAGADRLEGNTLGNLIDGGGGNDTLLGGAGEDILIDGLGRDHLSGGDGADVFVFRPDGETDRILDFEPDQDRINLSFLGRIYTLEQLELTQLKGGLRISFNGETLDVFSADGKDIRPENLTPEMLFDLAHMPVAPLPPLPQRLLGTDSSDLLQGGSGNDTLLGGGGADEIRGLGGNDCINASFEDEKFDAVSAQVVRLFQATLGRTPALEGHFSWTKQLANGDISGLEAAAGFMNSHEFQKVYGPTSNAEFATLLFQNVLGRDPAAAGLAGWTSQLDNGMSREAVVWHFSESPEFQSSMAAVAFDYSAAAYQAAWTEDIYRLFLTTLGREPNIDGLLTWANNLTSGMSFLDAITGFVAGPEFQKIYGPTSNAEFVALLFQNVLGRPPAHAGLETWVSNLERGMSREDVVSRFAQSPEFTATSFGGLVDFMQATGLEDILAGGAGDDILFGGALCDRFVFDTKTGGRDLVVGLEPWDEIQLEGSDFGNGQQAMAALVQQGNDLVLDTGDAQLVFVDTDRSELSADMFILV